MHYVPATISACQLHVIPVDVPTLVAEYSHGASAVCSSHCAMACITDRFVTTPGLTCQAPPMPEAGQEQWDAVACAEGVSILIQVFTGTTTWRQVVHVLRHWCYCVVLQAALAVCDSCCVARP